MFIVLGTNTNHDNMAWGPFDSFEEAKTAGYGMGGGDQLHQYQVLEVFDPSEPVPVSTSIPYDQDAAKMLVHREVERMKAEREDLFAPSTDVQDPPFSSFPPNVTNAPDKDLKGAGVGEGSGPETSEDAKEAAEQAAGLDDGSDDEPVEATLSDLRARASELDIPGRSSMSKDELQAAIDATEEE